MKKIYWLRTDLRVLDNQALSKCLQEGSETVFVFAQTKSMKRAGQVRRSFIEECLHSFKSQLKDQGFLVLETELLFSDYISTLFRTHPFEALYYTQEYAWEERQEEELVEAFCLERNISISRFDQGTLIAQKDLPFLVSDMPFVFTDFRKKIEANLIVQSLALEPFTPKESKGVLRLQHYLWKTNAINQYKETRNGMIKFDDSSKFSPWLNLGILSPRMIFHELKRYEAEVCENESTYWLFFELLWRDYFKFFSLKFGKNIFYPSGINQGISPNQKDLRTFQLWCEGKTQSEFINANMNELNQTGWMSNRGRQNVASYLIHDLGLDWTWGAAYFEEKLFDYDPDINWGNWLYLSGRGSDPRARKFNIARQAQTYDPVGEYQKIWSKSQL